MASGNFLRQSLKGTAWVCFFFTALLATLLVITHIQLRRADPLDSRMLKELRARYDKQPEEDVATHIRELDVLSRRAFFSGRRQIKTGSALLVVVLLLGAGCWTLADSLDRPRVVAPRAKNSLDHRRRANRMARRLLVGGGGIAAVCLGVWAAYRTLPVWLNPVNDQTKSVAIPVNPSAGQSPTTQNQPADPTVARDQAWPGFRGWNGLGKAKVSGLPLTWDGATGEKLAMESSAGFARLQLAGDLEKPGDSFSGRRGSPRRHFLRLGYGG